MTTLPDFDISCGSEYNEAIGRPESLGVSALSPLTKQRCNTCADASARNKLPTCRETIIRYLTSQSLMALDVVVRLPRRDVRIRR